MNATGSYEAVGARVTLKFASVVLVGSVGFAALLPSGPDGFIGGPLGVAGAIVAGAALMVAWVAAIWHASTLRPWTATAPRWVIISVLLFGSGVAGFFYYVLYARRFRS